MAFAKFNVCTPCCTGCCSLGNKLCLKIVNGLDPLASDLHTYEKCILSINLAGDKWVGDIPYLYISGESFLINVHFELDCSTDGGFGPHYNLQITRTDSCTLTTNTTTFTIFRSGFGSGTFTCNPFHLVLPLGIVPFGASTTITIDDIGDDESLCQPVAQSMFFLKNECGYDALPVFYKMTYDFNHRDYYVTNPGTFTQIDVYLGYFPDDFYLAPQAPIYYFKYDGSGSCSYTSRGLAKSEDVTARCDTKTFYKEGDYWIVKVEGVTGWWVKYRVHVNDFTPYCPVTLSYFDKSNHDIYTRGNVSYGWPFGIPIDSNAKIVMTPSTLKPFTQPTNPINMLYDLIATLESNCPALDGQVLTLKQGMIGQHTGYHHLRYDPVESYSTLTPLSLGAGYYLDIITINTNQADCLAYGTPAWHQNNIFTMYLGTNNQTSCHHTTIFNTVEPFPDFYECSGRTWKSMGLTSLNPFVGVSDYFTIGTGLAGLAGPCSPGAQVRIHWSQ